MEPLRADRVANTAITTFTSFLPSGGMVGKLAAGAFVALGAALYFGQTYIIYPSYAPQGSRTDVPTPDKHGMPHYEDLTLDTPDGLKIKAYLMLQGSGLGKAAALEEAKRRPTILFLHANAGNMGHRLPFAHIFYDRLKCNVFMLSYRGYGLSEGRATEKGMRSDAQLALDYITSHPALEHTKIVLYGQSIGGAVAADLAARNSDRVAGVILENTFLSLPKVAWLAMPVARPYLALGLLTEKWNSEKRVTEFRKDLPSLFLSGSEDELVPPEQLLQLFQLCASYRKRLREFANGTHNDTCVQPGYWQEIQRFLQEEIVERAKEEKPTRQDTFDEKRMEGAEDELQGTIGAGSIAP